MRQRLASEQPPAQWEAWLKAVGYSPLGGNRAQPAAASLGPGAAAVSGRPCLRCCRLHLVGLCVTPTPPPSQEWKQTASLPREINSGCCGLQAGGPSWVRNMLGLGHLHIALPCVSVSCSTQAECGARSKIQELWGFAIPSGHAGQEAHLGWSTSEQSL